MLNKQKDLTRQIDQAVTVLRDGGVIAFPTETVYGLGCDPRHPEAVQRIFQLKGRDPLKPLLLVASSLAQVREVAVLSDYAVKISDRYWPGPLTLILPVRESVSLAPGVILNAEISIRVSSSTLVHALTHEFGFPIVATSANLSGQAEAHSAKEVQNYFLNELDYIVDGGNLRPRKTSTVARVRHDGSVEIIRQGRVRLSSSLDLP